MRNLKFLNSSLYCREMSFILRELATAEKNRRVQHFKSTWKQISVSALFSCSLQCKTWFPKPVLHTLNTAVDAEMEWSHLCPWGSFLLHMYCSILLHTASYRGKQQVSHSWNGIACVYNSYFHLVGLKGASLVHTPNSVTEGSKPKSFYLQ